VTTQCNDTGDPMRTTGSVGPKLMSDLLRRIVRYHRDERHRHRLLKAKRRLEAWVEELK